MPSEETERFGRRATERMTEIPERGGLRVNLSR